MIFCFIIKRNGMNISSYSFLTLYHKFQNNLINPLYEYKYSKFFYLISIWDKKKKKKESRNKNFEYNEIKQRANEIKGFHELNEKLLNKRLIRCLTCLK